MDTHIDARALNIFGAFGLLLADRVFACIDEQPGLSRQEGVALIQVGLFSPSFANLETSLRLTQSATSRLVAKLAAKGLVTKLARSEDPREKFLRLTREGEERMQDILQARQAELHSVFAVLDSEEAARLLAIVSKILAANIGSKKESDQVCRMCDLVKCPQDRCPACYADQAARELPESRRLPTHLL